MTTIDDKVVAMSFESGRFEKGVYNTIIALAKLKASLKFPNAGKDLEKFNSTAQKMDLSHLSKSVDDIKHRLGALRLVAIAVFADIARKAVNAGQQFVKAFTISPIKAGFAEYSTNLNAIQTILANTQASGATLKDVNAALQDLNRYSDKTIYNFAQMARNIGTFTAAGVDLKSSTAAIKGIANLAALSGSNAEQASTAMYQLSQAISSGRVSLQDWNSVVNAGMGGTVFQRALATTAVAMGTLKKDSLKLVGPMKNVAINGESFRQSMQAGPGKTSWLSSKVLTETLQQFTSDLTDAQLKAKGFNDEQIKAIQQTAKTAMFAATEVKTISQVFDVAKETAGSGWSKTFQIIFGNFHEAKTTFTALSNTINGFINANAKARNKVLADWKALGGRTVLIDSIRIAFHNLGLILKPIKQAFRDIFPATTGKDLFKLTKNFKELAKALKPSKETVDNLRRTFRGFFALLDIGKQIVGGIFTVLGKLFGAADGGGGSFLNLTGNIGDFLVSVDQALKKGNRLHKFFVKLGDILSVPIEKIKELKDVLSKMFGGFSSGGFPDKMDGVSGALERFQKVWDKVVKTVGNGLGVLKPAFDAYISLIHGLGTAIGEAATHMNFEAILAVVRTGLFAALVLAFKNFFGKGAFVNQLLGGFGGITKGLLANVSGMFGALRGSAVAMQNNIKAKTLKEIAIAIALLTLSIVALSFVDPERLKSALAGIAVAMGELLGAMAIMDKVGKSGGFIKMPFIAATMILLAGAIDLLAISVIALSRLSWEELLKGLGAVGFLLLAISAASAPLSANSVGMIRSSVGIIAIAVALKILASAVKDFSEMNWAELAKGLGSIGVSIGAFVVAMRKMPFVPIRSTLGLIALAAALKIMASAITDLAKLTWTELIKGLTGVGVALGAMVLAMRLMPKNVAKNAVGLIILASAMKIISSAIMDMGGMSVKEIAKGLIALGGALIIMTSALYGMEGAIAGAVTLGITAAALALLTPALIALGKQSWKQILKGLVTLAAALTILGVAGALITPIVPGLLGLGVAVALIGGGLALAGAGIFLFAAGLSALVVAAPTGVGVLIAAFIELQKAIPEILKNLILGLLEVARAFAATAPKFVKSLVIIINTLIDVIIKVMPKVAQAFTAVIGMIVKVLDDNQDRIIKAGIDLLIALLKGIRDNIREVTYLVIDIIAEFLGAVAKRIKKIISAGADILLALVRGILDNVKKIIIAVGTIITTFLNAIGDQLYRIVKAGLGIVTKLIKGISEGWNDLINAGTLAIVKFVKGIGKSGKEILDAATNTIIKLANALGDNSVKLVNAGFKAIIKFLNGIADAIDKNAKPMRDAGGRIALAIVDGLTFGLTRKAGNVGEKAVETGKKILGGFSHALGINSPSTEMIKIGHSVIEGFAIGLSHSKPAIYATRLLAAGVIAQVKHTFKIASPSQVMHDLGLLVGEGFANGLRGSKDDIKNAFSTLDDALKKAEQEAIAGIVENNKKINELNKSSKPNTVAINEATKALDQNKDVLRKTYDAHVLLTKKLTDEKKELSGLSVKYQKFTDDLEEANRALEDLKQNRDDSIKSFTDQYSTLPDIVREDAEGNAVDQLAAYMAALKFQEQAVGAYQATLEQLRKLGLDDATYKKLLTEGTADQEFATQLLAGGKTAVSGLNALDAQLAKVSTTLATNAGNNLFKVGIHAAEELIKGLKSKKADLRKAMEEIADEMVKALKGKLKIKSPSEVFAEIGKQSMQGMAQGFSGSSKILVDAAEEAAKEALKALRKSVSDISDTIASEFDTTPVITPVFDLTRIRSQSRELGELTKIDRISAMTSSGQAAIISSQQTLTEAEKVSATPEGTSFSFEQNNYSPKALSEIEIYRQTKNQLSVLKSVLPI